jgi:hypothetical protein
LCTALGLDGNEANRSNFPLPTLQAQLQNLAVELHDRRGFFVLRGLDPSHYSAEDNVLILLGISSYIGETRGKQDDEGNMLGLFDVAPTQIAPFLSCDSPYTPSRENDGVPGHAADPRLEYRFGTLFQAPKHM